MPSVPRGGCSSWTRPTSRRAALIDFAFTGGAGNLRASALRRVIDHEEHADATAQFRRWVSVAGRNLPGLTRRRGEATELNADGS